MANKLSVCLIHQVHKGRILLMWGSANLPNLTLLCLSFFSSVRFKNADSAIDFSRIADGRQDRKYLLFVLCSSCHEWYTIFSHRTKHTRGLAWHQSFVETFLEERQRPVLATWEQPLVIVVDQPLQGMHTSKVAVRDDERSRFGRNCHLCERLVSWFWWLVTSKKLEGQKHATELRQAPYFQTVRLRLSRQKDMVWVIFPLVRTHRFVNNRYISRTQIFRICSANCLSNWLKSIGVHLRHCLYSKKRPRDIKFRTKG